MASDRAIVDPNGVVFGKKLYKPGHEDELFDALSDGPAGNAQALLERNIIQGDWKPTAPVKAEAKSASAKK
jgi:hypothetical protein